MMPNSGAASQVPIGPRLPLSRAGQAALRVAATLAGAAGDGEVTPLHLVAALLAESGADARPRDAPRPRLGTAATEVIRTAAAAAQRAGAHEVDNDVLLAAALRVAAPSDGRGAAPSATSLAHEWPGDDSGVTDHALRVLARRGATLLVLTGEAGAMPERVLADLVRRLHSPAVPAALQGAQVVSATGGPPMQSLGHRMHAQLRALGGTSPAVVVLDDVTGIVPAPGGIDALLTALTAGVRLVAPGDGETLAVLQQIAGLRFWLRSVPVPPASPAATLAIVRTQMESIGRHHGVRITAAAVDAAVRLSGRLRTDLAQPGAALELLDEGGAAASLRGGSEVEVGDLVTAAGGAGVVPGGILAARSGDVGSLERRLQERVIGQDHAVRSVANVVLRAETGVRDPDRPLGSFLFLGPTGVGKTELARTLASTLFGDETALLRLDMGEYQEPHSVARLVGAPPGYIGHAAGGHLSEPMRRRPYSVVLLDEIEKAHTDVLNVLLGMLDEGRVTDGFGHVVDARNAILVMTSNLGGRLIGASLSADDLEDHLRKAVADHFEPEFVGRVDEVIVFRRLSETDLTGIVDLQLERLIRRLAARHLDVAVPPDVRAWLAGQVHDSPHGARPLRAVVRRSVEDLVARAVLEGRLEPGGRLTLEVRNGTVGEAGSAW